jgi:hypothetical protein
MEENQDFKSFNDKKKKSENKVIIAIVLIGLGIVAYLASGGSNFLAVLGIIIGIVGLVFLIIGMVGFSQVKKNFKEQILTEMFKKIIPDVTYTPNLGLDEYQVYSSEVLKHADRFHSEDYIAGTVQDVKFISSDVKLEERHVQHTKNGTRVYYVAYFVGRVFRFDFNKTFTGNLQVLESGSPYSKRKFNRVKMESVDFNKKFRIFAEEDITAFYILTPDIMERIFDLEKRNPGRISMSFLGDHLYVAINNNHDTFELQMFRKLDETVIEEFKQDLLVIKDFIVSLKLNNKLFKKD